MSGLDHPSEVQGSNSAAVANHQASNNTDSAKSTAAAPVPQVSEAEADSALSRAYKQYETQKDAETFTEIIVPQKRRGQDYLKIFGLIIAFIILNVIVMMFISMLLPISLIGGAWLVWWLASATSREFEYVVTKGELDIDMIVARRKRKRVFSVKSKELELMASVKSDDYKQLQKQNLKLIDCSTDAGSVKNWFIVANYKGSRSLLLLNGEERLVANMHRFAPSKVRYNKMAGL
ncbi:hypothetical protein HCH52_02335 [Oscillospiraceae bacterium HV4-5-C5C]|nr:hypothetical protein [Oscillospiraceae bacterium HV4-5-C5C]